MPTRADSDGWEITDAIMTSQDVTQESILAVFTELDRLYLSGSSDSNGLDCNDQEGLLIRIGRGIMKSLDSTLDSLNRFVDDLLELCELMSAMAGLQLLKIM
jgi:hypothetical protein